MTPLPQPAASFDASSEPAPAMTQLLLDLEPPPRPTLDNFIVGANAEALAAVRNALGGPTDPALRFVYLWGERGSGRSHLLHAALDATDGVYLHGGTASAAALDAIVENAPGLIAIDDVEALTPAAQEALFHAINVCRSRAGVAMLVAGATSPRDLPLASDRDDLRSRLAWGLVYRLERLDDAEKDAALTAHARRNGFPLAAEVRRYLLTHCARDLGTLMALVDALDRRARTQQRLVTVPLIREFLAAPAPTEAA